MTDTARTPHRADHVVSVPRAIVRHGAHTLADIFDLRIEPGRALTIVGESGSGKSVLAHALMGTLPPELSAEGSMSIGPLHFDLADRRSRRHLWGRELALLPQEPSLALDPTMRVRQQVAEGAPGWRPRDAAALRLADDRLDHFGLGGAGSAYPHTLSGGMAQRVAYAAATIGGASVLIVDEPSKGLDAGALELLARLLDDHLAQGGLLLMITHDLRLARRIGGTVMVMRAATVVESGPADEVLTAPTHDYTRQLAAADPANWSFPWMRRASSGEPEPERDAPPLISARSLAKAYGERPVFDGLDIDIRAGERWAITGPSGVGKTTLGNVLLRLTSPDRGTVVHSPSIGNGRLQKLYQDPGLSFPRRVTLQRALGDVLRRYDVTEARVHALLAKVGLSPSILQRRPTAVSGGELQRIAIVRAMLPRPALLFADEATSRLDLASQQGTMDILMSELDEIGCALLMVTHDRAMADAVADRQLTL